MVMQIAAHLTSLINAFKVKKIWNENSPSLKGWIFVKQKDGVVYTLCINHPVKNFSNFRHPSNGGEF